MPVLYDDLKYDSTLFQPYIVNMSSENNLTALTFTIGVTS